MSRKLFSALVAVGLLGVSGGVAQSQPFPPKGVDTTPSMGVFRIVVEPKFAAYFDCSIPPSTPFWDGGTRKLTSPVLFDNSTTIQRSDPFSEGDPLDAGAACGDGGATAPDTIVGDTDFGLVPPGIESLSPEVHTNVWSLNLTANSEQSCGITEPCSGSPVFISIRAGLGQDPSFPKCPGEVASTNGVGFPARSFFNMFVEISFGSSPDPLVLYNKPADPLLVGNDNLNGFPPQVVYIHENSTAVPIFLRGAGTVNGGCGDVSWSDGEFFGWLTLAGHGTGLSCSDEAAAAQLSACDTFYAQVITDGFEAPLPGLGIKQGVLSEILALAGGTFDPRDSQRLRAAARHLTRATDPALWNDPARPGRKSDRVFLEEVHAVKALSDLLRSGSMIPDDILQGFITRLVGIDRFLAQTAIDDAVLGGGKAHDIAKANEELARGDAEAADGDFSKAIERYREAWKFALKSL